MTSVQEVQGYLRDALIHPERLPYVVNCFQHAVWEAPDRERGHDREWQVLEAIARRIAWYIADEEMRRADPEAIGPDETAIRIQQGLEELARARRAGDGGLSR